MGIVRQSGTVSLTPNTKKQYIKQLRIPFKNLLANPTADTTRVYNETWYQWYYILVNRS